MTGDGLLDEAIVLLADLIGFPTVTQDSNLDLLDHAEALLAGVGARVGRTYDEHQTKANLFATIGPIVDGGVVLSGHTDVVPADPETWSSPPFIAARRADRIHGRGAVDMKGFIACVLASAPRFAAAPLLRPLHIALTFDEEIGCHGAPLLLAELGRTGPRPCAAIVGEPTSMGIVAAHKGCYEFTTTITGLEGHASAPERGVSAVEHASRYVTRLLELRDQLAHRAGEDGAFDPPGSTLNVGTISGGTARNVVAGECTIEWEMRSTRGDDVELVARVVAEIEHEMVTEMRRTHPEASVATETVGAVGGLEARDGSPAVELAQRLLDEGATRVVPFGTEAGLYQQAGIPAVVCGPGSIDVAHRPDEYVEIDQLERCLGMLERLRDHLCTADVPARLGGQ